MEQLFLEGKKISVPPLRVFFLFLPEDAGLQLATGASSKVFKKAVDRNRVKRVIREAWRLQKNELQELVKAQKKQLLVFISYTAKELPEYKQVFSKTGMVIKKLIENT